MDVPPQEHRRTKISTGSSPNPKLNNLPKSHPFTQQLDIVFPSSEELQTILCRLETSYYKSSLLLSDIVQGAGTRSFSAVTNDTDTDDCWCIDPRGLLTLSVGKYTYERLSLVGKKLPFKNCDQRHVIRLPLQKTVTVASSVTKRNAALKEWDARRARPWTVLSTIPLDSTQQPIPVKCQVRHLPNIQVPNLVSIPPRPDTSKTKASSSSDAAELEDWNTDMADIFEWAGMACLGAQRLSANDRTDPYISTYTPPTPSTIQNATHLRWRGLIGPEFIQLVLDAITAASGGPSTSSLPSSFIAITAQAFPNSPVSYIPDSESGGEGPMRMPREDAEDTWCLILTRGQAGSGDAQSQSQWAMVESVGKWDTRWG